MSGSRLQALRMHLPRLASAGVLLVLLSACAVSSPPLAPTPEFAPVHPPELARERPVTGSIFGNHREESWFGQKRDYYVGDVVTIVLDEQTQAQRAQSASINRESSNDMITPGAAAVLRPRGGAFADLGFGGNTIESAGGGTTDQQATLSATIAATVVEVLPNGNLVIRGEKRLTLTEGSEVIQVSGIIRSRDIAPDNTVLSRRIANAQITYLGTGDMARAARPGWGTRLLLNIWPF